MYVLVGRAAGLELLMGRKADVSQVFGVVGLADLAEVAGRACFERILR